MTGAAAHWDNDARGYEQEGCFHGVRGPIGSVRSLANATRSQAVEYRTYDRSSSSDGGGEWAAAGEKNKKGGGTRKEKYPPVPFSYAGTRRRSRDDTLSTSIATSDPSSAVTWEGSRGSAAPGDCRPDNSAIASASWCRPQEVEEGDDKDEENGPSPQNAPYPIPFFPLPP